MTDWFLPLGATCGVPLVPPCHLLKDICPPYAHLVKASAPSAFRWARSAAHPRPFGPVLLDQLSRIEVPRVPVCPVFSVSDVPLSDNCPPSAHQQRCSSLLLLYWISGCELCRLTNFESWWVGHLAWNNPSNPGWADKAGPQALGTGSPEV